MSTYLGILIPKNEKGREAAKNYSAATNPIPFDNRAVLCKIAGVSEDTTNINLDFALKDKGFEIYVPTSKLGE